MRKIIILCIACLALSNVGTFGDDFANPARELEYGDRSIDFYTQMSKDGINFYNKMQKCSLAKFKDANESVYGKTKNGKCHYSYKLYYQGDLKEYHCMLPMNVALGYATTALDVNDYYETDNETAQQRLEQNNQIRKIMLDYCQKKPKPKSSESSFVDSLINEDYNNVIRREE